MFIPLIHGLFRGKQARGALTATKIYLRGRQGGWDSYRGVFLYMGGGGASREKTRGEGGRILKNDVMAVHNTMYVDRWDSEAPQGGSGAGTGTRGRTQAHPPTQARA